jgi:dynein heavy chain
VEDLSQASPATVSRAGMIFLTLEDLGWWPYAESWIEKRIADGTHAVCFQVSFTSNFIFY